MKNTLFATIISTSLLFSYPAFAADWMPTFTPGQAVYIDPALAHNQKAPVQFGPELEKSVKALGSKNDINYYVVAIEANNASTDKPLGVTKGAPTGDTEAWIKTAASVAQ